MSVKPVIDVDHLSFSYDDFPVLADVTFSIGEREFICMVGPNGGGKTTLLKLILGLLKPGSGTVQVFGESPERSRHRIGYVPQHAMVDQAFPVTAIDVVLMGRINKKKSFRPFGRTDTEAAHDALASMAIADLAGRPFSALSGGQRQRVLIARALAGEPEMLLLDEPTSSLDLHVENEFYEMLREINKHLTVIVVSHDIGFVTPFSTSVMCVKRNVMIHPTSEVSGANICDLYGTDMLMVRHDHRCTEGGHQCRDS